MPAGSGGTGTGVVGPAGNGSDVVSYETEREGLGPYAADLSFCECACRVGQAPHKLHW